MRAPPMYLTNSIVLELDGDTEKSKTEKASLCSDED